MPSPDKLFATSLALFFCVACGGANDVDGGGNCPAYLVPAGTDLAQPVVSLKSDVMKVFNNSCGLSMCHGSTTDSQGGLFLGEESAQRSDASQVRAGIVNHPSRELPSMSFVEASEPAESYLMHKLDGDQCQFNHQCSGGSCLALMPSGSTLQLPVATRDVVRRWISQGAQDN